MKSPSLFFKKTMTARWLTVFALSVVAFAMTAGLDDADNSQSSAAAK